MTRYNIAEVVKGTISSVLGSLLFYGGARGFEYGMRVRNTDPDTSTAFGMGSAMLLMAGASLLLMGLYFIVYESRAKDNAAKS
jgi:hypothetical protein